MIKFLSIEQYFETIDSYEKHLSIAHYERMIKWAKAQPKSDASSGHTMLKLFGEHCGVDFCSYCNIYYDDSCNNCPLGNYGDCCNGLHSKVVFSKTWSDWIINATKVLDYIKRNG